MGLLKLESGAQHATGANDRGTEKIWKTLTALLVNLGSFAIYTLLLTNLNGFLMLVVTLTSVAGFLVNRNASQWEYLHKDEKQQFWKHTDYIEKKTRSMEAAKDIRIFGLEPRLNEIHDGVLRLENVTFRYHGTGTNLFEHLNLTIRPGEKVAVVGLNGAGKTTLVKLLCGFCDPDEGWVLLNGTDIREYNRQDYYKLLCAVYQDYSVLDVTVAENVAQQQENIDMERVNDCLEKAGLKDFVSQLSQGLQTHAGREVYLDGVLFSGGQTQRLMLARALYKDGPILVLDEPTAALDPVAEAEIYSKFNDIAGDKTAIYISHRLSSCKFCDEIAVFHDGAVIQQGTHQALLADASGKCFALWHAQAQYYAKEQEQGTA